MLLIELNKDIIGNYAFFDPSAPIRLTLSEPRGLAPRFTESILRGLRGKTLIDVENKVDIEKGILKNGEEQRQEERKEEEGKETVIPIDETVEVRDLDEAIEKLSNQEKPRSKARKKK